MRVGDQVELLIDTLNVPRGKRGTVVDLTRNGCHVSVSNGASNTTEVLALRRLDVCLIEPAARKRDIHKWLQEWDALLLHLSPVPPIDLDACRLCGAPDGWSDMLRELRDKVAVLARAMDEIQRLGEASVELRRHDEQSTTEDNSASVAISRELLRTSPQIGSDLTAMIREERKVE